MCDPLDRQTFRGQYFGGPKDHTDEKKALKEFELAEEMNTISLFFQKGINIIIVPWDPREIVA